MDSIAAHLRGFENSVCREEKKYVKKAKKLSKKVLTKGGESGIICKHSARAEENRIERRVQTAWKKKLEKSWKNFQKGIDKRLKMWYNNKVASEAALIFENWTTRDEVQSVSERIQKVRTNLVNSLREYYSNKSKTS